jgi:hypothetical protein
VSRRKIVDSAIETQESPLERRKRKDSLRSQARQAEALGGVRCISCGGQPLPGKTKCLNHYVRQLLHGAARVGTTRSSEAFPPSFKVDDVAVDWALAQFERQGGRCYLSGIALVIGENACLDHIFSRARYQHHNIAGGLENLAWADADVNRSKNQLTPTAFLELCQQVVDNQRPRPVHERDFWGGARSVSMEERGKGRWIRLRATMPPKPRSRRCRAHVQAISLGLRGDSPDGLRKAKVLRARLESELLSRTFRWENWI